MLDITNGSASLDRLTLERRQVWIYLSTIIGGMLVGSAWPGVNRSFEALLWPTLTLLLYATFLQVPLLHLREAFRDHRFVTTVLTGNFIVLPALAWWLIQWLPSDPALRLGVLLVLLVPCTDWFITFSQLGGGNVPRAIAVTPINLLLQLLLLPAYLWLMTGADLSAALTPGGCLACTGRCPRAPQRRRRIRTLDRSPRRTGDAARAPGLVASAIPGAGGLSDRRRAGRGRAGCAALVSGGRTAVRCLPVPRRIDRKRTGPADGATDRSRANRGLQPRHTQFLRSTAFRLVAAWRLGGRCRSDRRAVSGRALRDGVLPVVGAAMALSTSPTHRGDTVVVSHQRSHVAPMRVCRGRNCLSVRFFPFRELTP